MSEEKPIKKRGKPGALSTEEMKFIKENAEIMEVNDISARIGKSVASIRKYAYKENLVIREKDENNSSQYFKIRRYLRARPFWKSIQSQFNTEEVKAFENMWIDLYIQFDEDVKSMEELQMNKHLSLIILRDRYMKHLFSLEQEIQMAKDLLNEEWKKPKDQKNLKAAAELNSTIEKLQKTQLSVNKEIKNILDVQKETEHQLNISRNQRVKGVIDSTQNWTGILRLLNESAEIREQVGKHIEIMRAAQQNEKFKLFSYHNFIDHSVDRLMLTKESVDFEAPEDKEEIKNDE